MVTVTSEHKEIRVFEWSYSEESGSEQQVDNIKQENTLYNVLIIKPNTLMEGKTYTFTVKGLYHNNLSLFNIFILIFSHCILFI